MPRIRRSEARFCFAAALCTAAALVACDAGDDTVHPAPASGGAAGARQDGSAGRGGTTIGGEAGRAGAAGAGVAGAGGKSGSAGNGSAGVSGAQTAGAAGAGTSGSAGTSAAGGSTAGAAGTAAGGSAGAGLGGASAGAAGSATGISGAAGSPSADPYSSACAGLEGALLKCDSIADGQAQAAGSACRESAACAQAFYGDRAPAVLACSQLACRVPTHVDQPMFDCVETTALTADAKLAFNVYKQKMEQASDTCQAMGDKTSPKDILRAATSGVPFAARPEVFAALASCVEQPCAQIASCVTSRVAAYCPGPKFFWATSLLAAQTD